MRNGRAFWSAALAATVTSTTWLAALVAAAQSGSSSASPEASRNAAIAQIVAAAITATGSALASILSAVLTFTALRADREQKARDKHAERTKEAQAQITSALDAFTKAYMVVHRVVCLHPRPANADAESVQTAIASSRAYALMFRTEQAEQLCLFCDSLESVYVQAMRIARDPLRADREAEQEQLAGVLKQCFAFLMDVHGKIVHGGTRVLRGGDQG